MWSTDDNAKKTWRQVDCPGGSREEVTINYETARDAYYDSVISSFSIAFGRVIEKDHPLIDAFEQVIDAALGITEAVKEAAPTV